MEESEHKYNYFKTSPVVEKTFEDGSVGVNNNRVTGRNWNSKLLEELCRLQTTHTTPLFLVPVNENSAVLLPNAPTSKGLN